MATYAFDDEPTLTSEGTGTNTVTLEFSEELVGGSKAFVVSEWCEQHGEWVRGEWIDGETTLVRVQPGDETR